MSRKPVTLDPDQVTKLSMLGATTGEIAAFFSCSAKTIDNKYSKYVAKGRELRKLRLREMQWEAAKRGNVVMLIWLGKQDLGQRDVAPRQYDPEGLDKPLPWED
jgi:hypothetical protein